MYMVHYSLSKNNRVKVIKLKDIGFEGLREVVKTYDETAKVFTEKGSINSIEIGIAP